MPFYEIAYETGRTSVAFYADDDEARSAIKAHHNRAIVGQSGGPIGQPAERVSTVYVYDKHPDDFNGMQSMSADVLKKEVASLIDKMKDENGVVAIDQLSVEVRALSHPMQEREEPFGSIFKAKEKGILSWEDSE